MTYWVNPIPLLIVRRGLRKRLFSAGGNLHKRYIHVDDGM